MASRSDASSASAPPDAGDCSSRRMRSASSGRSQSSDQSKAFSTRDQLPRPSTWMAWSSALLAPAAVSAPLASHLGSLRIRSSTERTRSSDRSSRKSSTLGMAWMPNSVGMLRCREMRRPAKSSSRKRAGRVEKPLSSRSGIELARVGVVAAGERRGPPGGVGVAQDGVQVEVEVPVVDVLERAHVGLVVDLVGHDRRFVEQQAGHGPHLGGHPLHHLVGLVVGPLQREHLHDQEAVAVGAGVEVAGRHQVVDQHGVEAGGPQHLEVAVDPLGRVLAEPVGGQQVGAPHEHRAAVDDERPVLAGGLADRVHGERPEPRLDRRPGPGPPPSASSSTVTR